MKTSNSLESIFNSYLTPSEQLANKKLGRIASEIEMWRVEHNMTQKDFAKFMGVTQAQVSKWESGEYNFSIKTLANLASRLNHSFDGMFDLGQNKSVSTSFYYNNRISIPSETSFQYNAACSDVPIKDSEFKDLEYRFVTQGA